MDSTVHNADTIRGGDKWMLVLGWACFVGIAAILAVDLTIGLFRFLSR